MSVKTRTITGLSFGVVMIVGTLATSISAAVLYALVGILCLWELSGLLVNQDSKNVQLFRRAQALLIGMLPTVALLTMRFFPETNIPVPLFIAFLFLPYLTELFTKGAKPFDYIGYIYLGFVYIGIPTALMISVALDASGRFLIMASMLLIWANDVFAYFIGSFLGKNKIFPHISPNKTLEGTIGGFICAILWGIVSFFLWYYLISYEIWQWMVLGAVCSVFGIIGDLVASLLKRSLNIKDTGTILPGHGGLIDRFDAFIFAFPFVVITVIYLFQDTRFNIPW